MKDDLISVQAEAQIKRNKKWIVEKVDFNWLSGYTITSICPCCWKESQTRTPGPAVYPQDILFDYCPNCGADMRGEQNE